MKTAAALVVNEVGTDPGEPAPDEPGGHCPGPSAAAGRVSLRVAASAFVAMASVYFFSYFQRAAVPGTIFNELQADLGLSAAAVASLGSMFTWIYGGMQIFVGMLADRYGGVRTLLGGGLAMAAGAALFPLAPSSPALFAARALTGLGASFMYLSIIKELDRLFGARHFPVVLGVLLFVGYSGGMAATLPFERAAAAFGWRHSLLAVAGLILLAVLLAGAVLRSLGRDPRAGRRLSLGPLVEVFRNRSSWALLAGSLISFPIFFVIQTVLGKKFLQDFGGLSSPASAMFILIMTAVSALTVMAGGLIPRMLGERRRPVVVAGGVILVAATGVLLAGVLVRAPGWIYLLGFVLLAAACLSLPAGIASMKELNHPEFTAAGISIINGLAYVGAGTIGQVGGLILDRYRDQAVASGSGWVYPQAAYVALFGFLAGLAILNLVSTFFVPETRGSHGGARTAPERLKPEGALP